MKTAYLDVDKDWGIIVIYDYNILHFDELAAIMETFKMSKRSINSALRILSEPNTGMSVSREDIRMSAIFISQATTNAQFWDTAAHEIAHCVTHIIDYYGVGYDTEDAAYLTGFLMRELVEEVGSPCN